MHHDTRGTFRKPVGVLPGKALTIQEVFWSESRPSVLRGMHTGASEHQGDKLITVIKGEVMDALVDLRPGRTLGSTFTLRLNEDSPSLLVPAGVAHGFQVLSRCSAIVLYIASNSYEPEFDSGVNPLTCGIQWPMEDAVVSDRDISLPDLEAVVSAGGWAVKELE